MTSVPKPTKRHRCIRCGKAFASAGATYRHVLKCRAGGMNRLGNRAKKTVVQGEAFPSRLEADTWLLLKSLEHVGYYKNVRRYQTVELMPGIRWKVDFAMELAETGETEWAEAKGVESERYILLLKIWNCVGPGRITIYKADRDGNPVEKQTIIPPRRAA